MQDQEGTTGASLTLKTAMHVLLKDLKVFTLLQCVSQLHNSLTSRLGKEIHFRFSMNGLKQTVIYVMNEICYFIRCSKDPRSDRESLW